MDIATHSMAGMLIGTLAVGKQKNPYPYILTGVLGGALPDIDAVIGVLAYLGLIEMEIFYKYHRVFTNNIFAVPLIALLAALPAWKWVKDRYAFFYLVALLGVISHMIGDFIAYWDMKFFWPISDYEKHLNLFKGKDTSYIVLIVTTLSAMGMLYLIQKRLNKEAENEASDDTG